jgi:hypothetical protein
MALLMAFTTICTFLSLLPETTSAAPVFAFRSAAAFSMPFFSLASAMAGADTEPSMAASSASATCPVSEGRWV